jgi:hypothetical protein
MGISLIKAARQQQRRRRKLTVKKGAARKSGARAVCQFNANKGRKKSGKDGRQQRL